MSAAEAGVPGSTVPESHEIHTSTGLDNTKMAMWAFLGSECLFFGSMITTYLLYRNRVVAGPKPHEIYDIPYTSVSSFVLLMSSLTMVLALAAIQRGDHKGLRAWLLATAFLGVVFIGGQIYEFTAFVEEGLTISTSTFGTRSSCDRFSRSARNRRDPDAVVPLRLSVRPVEQEDSRKVELIGLYWHFVDIVWIVIFTIVY